MKQISRLLFGLLHSAEILPAMADMVASAVVQEVVSRAISFVFGNREEQAPDLGLHSAERLEMALSDLAFVLERAAKLPITDVSLLHRRKIFKLAYVEGTDLLSGHRQGRHGGGEAVDQPGKRRKLWATGRANESSSSTTLSTDNVRRFEWFADLAGKFLRDVESGCSLRRYSFCNPFLRHLLEGRTLRYYDMAEQGSRRSLRRLYMWPVCLEERGVETMLEYWYDDYQTPEKCFRLSLMLRVSEGTDIVGTAVKCLRSTMASQFKTATETATGELTNLLVAESDLQYVSDLRAPPSWAEAATDEDSHTKYSHSLRPDPVCCNDNVSSELSYPMVPIPEQVILFSFGCYMISEHDQYSSRCASTAQLGASVMRGDEASPVELAAMFAPHFVSKEDHPQEGHALEKLREGVERRHVGIQEVIETLRSKATDCFKHQPELTGYAVAWIAKHGFAVFDVRRPSTEVDAQASGRSRNRRRSIRSGRK